MRAAAPLAVVAALVACAGPARGSEATGFRDITAMSGLDFVHSNGATGERCYYEVIGSGGCVLDADGDGRLDLYLVTSVGPNRFFRNLGGLRFEDATASSGLGDAGYGMGAVPADFDGDGDTDVYVTNFGANRLFVNGGDGTFRERSAAAGVDDGRWGCTAAWLDADGDGWLDLYVTNYVDVEWPDLKKCYNDRNQRIVCHPHSFAAQADVFYRNRGDGTFEDATAAFGLEGPAGRGLGVITLDFDHDGWTDLYVANDLDPNYLFRNRGGGGFEDTGFFSGTSHSEGGHPESGMGIAAADYDNDGRTDLFVTNYVEQTNTLYHNEGQGLFLDVTATSGLGAPSLPHVGWGTVFLDYDRDGWKDLVLVNGHTEMEAERVTPNTFAQQPDLLFRNLGDGRFHDVTAEVAPDLGTRRVSRGAIAADLDDDGDADLVVIAQNAPALLFENTAGAGHHWIGFALRGAPPGLDAVGARVEVHASGRLQTREVRSGGYLGGDDRRLLFGLGRAAAVDSVLVAWPGGLRTRLRNPAPDRYHAVGAPER